MHTYPHKIENGEGEVITFLGVVRDRDGDRMEVELTPFPALAGWVARLEQRPSIAAEFDVVASL